MKLWLDFVSVKPINIKFDQIQQIPNQIRRNIIQFRRLVLILLLTLVCVLIIKLDTLYYISGDALYCYRCNSNHPGCGDTLNWLWYWGETCPEPDDICVKIIERKGGNLYEQDDTKKKKNALFFPLFQRSQC